MDENTIRALLLYASRFDFRFGHAFGDILTIERIYDNSDYSFYWTIQLGGTGASRTSRWSRKHQVFRYRDDNESIEDYINDTKYELEEAFNLIMSNNLYNKHIEKVRAIKKRQ